MENLLNCDGRKFKANIEGDECRGVITVEDDEVYICQDKLNGSDCKDKKGFKFSWGVNKGSKGDFDIYSITDFELIEEQKTIVKKQRYIYKGNLYTIFITTKMKVNGVWMPCVVYQTLYDNPDGEFWVRSAEEFYQLFKEVK
jgi:hypothetical protein